MANLGSQIMGAASCLFLYFLVVIVFYKPSSPPSRPLEKSVDSEKLEEHLISVARQGGIAAAWQVGQASGVALSKEDPSKGSSLPGQQCQAMFTVEKDGEIWPDDGPYAELSDQLPSLLISWARENSSATASVYPSTRLSFLNGSVPYVPCKVTRELFLASVAHHRHRPLTFDILGRRRDTLNHTTDRQEDPTTPHNPSPFLAPDEDIFRSFEEPYDHLAFNTTLFPLHDSDVPLESYELRVTLVWAPLASAVPSPLATERMKVDKLKAWEKQEVIPDVIVVGFGTWMMLMKKMKDELVPYTEAEYLVRPIVAQLTHLAARTPVLWWHQSRYRWFNFENDIAGEEKEVVLWQKNIDINQFSDGIPFMDAWLWLTSLRGTGMWQWDSTVPFNLANHRECLRLRSSGLAEENIYYGKWWNCQDVHHSSYETNVDEIQMLLNLLCNPYLAPDSQYCCSSVQ
ncbi:uncharacterized protein LOC119589375 [Penaeus monodon]|uniref:uncharacterized protein LOC119589375 n=1 Tax=Penaeus monodon TaxID=6687 RepID=UPI0018A76AE3|nr:uncharacterized protein LOC119589375 [Penaeus monodon]